MNLKEIIKYEKTRMNRIRFIMNYIIVPIFLFVLFTGLAIGLVLMETNEVKNTPYFIGILIFEGVIMIALLASVPLVRKKELLIEMKKHDYDLRNVTDKAEYLFLDREGKQVILKNKGVVIDIYDDFYDYNQFKIKVITTNYLKLVNVYLEFSLIDSVVDFEPSFEIQLTNELIYAINSFKIQIANKDVLDYIINNKGKAFKEIYSYGYPKS